MQKYDFQKIEKKWQAYWEEESYGKAEDFSNKPKHYHLVEFPYPSGDGLHVGHCMGYGASDAYCRMKRLQGKNVLFPIGWDAFGLPTENYAIKNKIKPQDATEKNINNFRRQMKSLGYSFDFSREVNTTDPEYYKWTQWIFIQMYKKGLAYKKEMTINWCPSCKIGLANEEVISGCCERCGTKAIKREKSQWMLKITKYADRLYKDLDSVDYEPQIITQQRNWIGPSEGNVVDFRVVKLNGDNPVIDINEKIEVFTTRLDTIFGVTYLVIAPDHKNIKKLLNHIENKKEAEDYIENTKNKSDIERLAEEKEKTGIEMKGIVGINPVNKRILPIYIADYVLADYATGAVMAVPCHDFRDANFAKKYNLPIEMVISKKDSPYKSYLMGVSKITDDELKDHNITISEVTQTGHRKILIPHKSIENYQKLIIKKLDPGYWNEYVGEKIVFIFKDKNNHVDIIELTEDTKEKIEKLTQEFIKEDKTLGPVIAMLAENDFYTPEIIHQEYGILINSGKYNGLSSKEAIERIEKDIDAKNITTYKLRDWLFSRQHYWGEPIPMIYCEKCGWEPVQEKDLPVVLPEVEYYEPTDTGESPLSKITDWVNVKCPKCGGSAKRETDTMPNWAGSSWYYLAYAQNQNAKIKQLKSMSQNEKENIFNETTKELEYWLPVDIYNGGMEHTTLHLLYSRFWHKFLFDLSLVHTSEPYQKRIAHGIILSHDGQKMSKSRGNVINPDEMIEKYGADTLRAYIMFIGPYNQSSKWNTNGIIGVHKFSQSVYSNFKKVENGKDSQELLIKLNEAITNITNDIESFSFNTVVSNLMELNNIIKKEKIITPESYQKFLLLLYPVMPHLASELWEKAGFSESIEKTFWPKPNNKILQSKEFNIAVSVNGKTKCIIQTNNTNQENIVSLAYKNPQINKLINGRKVNKIIYITGRIINFVIE